MQTLDVTEDSAPFELSHHDAARQRVTTNGPVAIHYCWPSELDLMARQVGLQLTERYADWNRRPFESTSGSQAREAQAGQGAER